nr:hypothetical protein [Candidatus Aenigmarchaeota archaeon]NIP40615.1 hypothetical protein [Candidatus Aenigmarchaeota archaeon]
IIRLQDELDWKEAIDTFRNLKSKEVRPLLNMSIPNSELFIWRFIHVCQRFGIISRDAEYGKGYIKKIAEVYMNTLPHKEALNEIEQEKLDVERAKEVLDKMKSKEIRIETRPGLSPLAELALKRSFEIIAPSRPEKEIFRVFKRRLMETKIGLACTQCGWATINTVKDLKDPVHCPLCYAGMVAIVPYRYVIQAQEIVKKKKAGKKLSEEEEKWFNHMLNTASLVVASGKDAALVLAGRGVGPKTAGRVLAKMKKDEELLREILRAERNYVKNRRFWKD